MTRMLPTVVLCQRHQLAKKTGDKVDEIVQEYKAFGGIVLRNPVIPRLPEDVLKCTVAYRCATGAGSDYHVILTPVGECRGLYVDEQDAKGP